MLDDQISRKLPAVRFGSQCSPQAPKFDRRLSKSAVDTPVKFQNDMTNLKPNFTATRLQEI